MYACRVGFRYGSNVNNLPERLFVDISGDVVSLFASLFIRYGGNATQLAHIATQVVHLLEKKYLNI